MKDNVLVTMCDYNFLKHVTNNIWTMNSMKNEEINSPRLGSPENQWGTYLKDPRVLKAESFYRRTENFSHMIFF